MSFFSTHSTFRGTKLVQYLVVVFTAIRNVGVVANTVPDGLYRVSVIVEVGGSDGLR